MKKVLLVEDNLENAALFVRILETGGYEVVHKTHALEGLRVAHQQPFDAIFLDFDLPDLDGSQVCLALRNSKAKLPIIALTAHADRVTRRKAKMFGFSAFISKPCTDEDLLGTLQILLVEPDATAPNPLSTIAQPNMTQNSSSAG